MGQHASRGRPHSLLLMSSATGIAPLRGSAARQPVNNWFKIAHLDLGKLTGSNFNLGMICQPTAQFPSRAGVPLGRGRVTGPRNGQREH